MSDLAASGRSDSAGVRLVSLTKRYRAMTAVDSIDLEVRDGELFTILGASGSGKSTTLLMVAGFTPPTSGQILIGDQLVNDIPPQKRNVGMIFQHYANFPHLTLFENIAFPLRARGFPRDHVQRQVGEMMRLVQLEGLEDRLPHQLSGGQQQRAAIARALAFRPRVLLMDEPLGALDKKLREYMQREIKDLQRQLGLTVIYITHDQEEALSLSDRIAIMRAGRVEQVGTPRELYEQPDNLYVAEFLGNSNVLSGVAGDMDADGYWPVHQDGGVAFKGRAIGPLRSGAAVRAMVRPEQVRLAPAAEPSENSCPGRVLERKYLGDVSFMHVRLASGALMSVKDLTDRFGDELHVNDTVHAIWRPDVTRIYPADV